MSNLKEYLVIDNGGTFIKYARMQENGSILKEGQVPTPPMSATEEDYFKVLDELVADYGQNISGLAFSSPGNIDSENGFCYTAGALVYFNGKPFADLVEERYHLPVSVENDGKCAALAEYWKGSLSDVKNGATIVIGTGIGGGIIINGQLLRGEHFAAGEFSFKVANVDKMKEHAGYYSTNASVGSLCHQLSQNMGIEPGKMNGKRVVELVEQGHGTAVALWKKYIQNIAALIYDLQSVLDLKRFAIGGGISRNPRLLQEVEVALDRLFAKHPFKKYGIAVHKPEVVCCEFYNEANLVGALYHHLKRFGEI